MSKFNDGGPAFPRPASDQDMAPDYCMPAQGGMTLHQYFAGLAMQANVARGGYDKFSHIAIDSLAAADAMVAAYDERNKNQVNITPDMITLRCVFEAGMLFVDGGASHNFTAKEVDEEFEKKVVKPLLADGMKIKAGTIEVQTAPKGAYEALVHDLAKMLGCDERDGAIKEAIYQLKIRD